jgi:hypothetical protein
MVDALIKILTENVKEKGQAARKRRLFASSGRI